jgi:hypothetical protein
MSLPVTGFIGFPVDGFFGISLRLTPEGKEFWLNFS